MKLLTKKQVAKELGCSESWVDKMTKAGKLPFVKIGGLVRYPDDIAQRLFEGTTDSPRLVNIITANCGCVVNPMTSETVRSCLKHIR